MAVCVCRLMRDDRGSLPLPLTLYFVLSRWLAVGDVGGGGWRSGWSRAFVGQRQWPFFYSLLSVSLMLCYVPCLSNSVFFLKIDARYVLLIPFFFPCSSFFFFLVFFCLAPPMLSFSQCLAPSVGYFFHFFSFFYI